MEIREGYKQTEVGVIPDDWDVKELGKLCSFTQGVQIPQSRQLKFNKNGYIRYLYIRDFFTDNFEWYVQDLFPSKVMEVNDIMMVNTGNTTGSVYSGAKGVLSNNAFRIGYNKVKLFRDYLFFLLTSSIVQDRLKALFNSAGQPHVGHGNIARVKIPIPPTMIEQTAIAQVLSDVDVLISSLEKLIAKKQYIKQGAMQQLLTGKKRLLGFSEEWEAKRFGDLGSTYGGLSGKTKQDFGNGSARYITFLNIMNNVVIDPKQFEFVKISPSERQNQALKGDLFFNGSSETPEEVGMCAVLLAEVKNVFLNSFCFGFRLYHGAKADGVFLAYFFRSNEGRELLYSLAQGATRYNLSKRSLLKLEFQIPRLDEQRAIATVLSDMDADIEALERKLSKYRMVKQGMMQELLTGKKRLI